MADGENDAPRVVVSGGSRGVGLAVAKRFGDLGAHVAVLGRSAETLDGAAEEIRRAGAASVLTIPTDATDDDSVSAAFTQISRHWPDVNVLVNAVGPAGSGRFEAIDDDIWHRAFTEGVMTSVHCIRHALPLLRAATWGRIVNLTAMSVQHQAPGLIAYTAAKAALASLTKNLARSLAADGILVNAVAPGATLTEPIRALVRQAGGNPDDPVAAFDVMAAQFGSAIDLGRVGLPSEVAEAVAFCASRSNTFMTGAQLNVDGGSDFL